MRSKEVTAAGVLFACACVAAQQPATPAPDANGNYRWTYVDSNGKERQFTFFPATRIAPTVRTAVAEIDGITTFTYTIGNGASAMQRLRGCIVEVSLPTKAVATPKGWEPARDPTRVVPRVGWFVLGASGPEQTGIRAGSEASGFQISSPALPGVVEFRCRGQVQRAEEPDDLPEGIQEQLGQLAGLDYLAVPAMGPIVPIGDGSVFALVSRIVRNYRRPLQASNVVDKVAVVQALDALLTKAPKDNETLREGIRAAMGLVARPQDDAWSSELSRGLQLALDRALRRLQ